MNNQGRKQARYERRKREREERRKPQPTFDEVFTFSNLWKARCKCVKNVGWKASVQNYRNHSITNLSRAYRQLNNGNFKGKGFYEFDIVDRGKPRHILSVHISERVIQRCLCDFALIPILSPKLIYDNGACIKKKGIDFAHRRMKHHLRNFYKKYGTNDGYALMTDFSKYFDSIPHARLIEMVGNVIEDKRIVRLLANLINDFPNGVGLGLGSQISQICALFYPHRLDLTMQSIGCYCRYMDDTSTIAESKTTLRVALGEILSWCDRNGIKPNKKKTQIVKLSRGIPWLKMLYTLKPNGNVEVKPNKASFSKMRKKLKTLHNQHKEMETSYFSWRGHILKADCKNKVKRMDALYNKLLYTEVYNGSYTAKPVY